MTSDPCDIYDLQTGSKGASERRWKLKALNRGREEGRKKEGKGGGRREEPDQLKVIYEIKN